MRTGLVLGAGGAGAWVWHLGVLDGLAEAGIRAGSSSPVVGTSAGAVAGAFLLLGEDQDSRVEDWLRPPSPDDRRRVLGIVRENFTLRPTHRGLARRLSAGVPPIAAIAPLLPPGPFPHTGLAPWFDADDEIPEGLWVPAVDVESAETVVFGRDRLDVGLRDALVATMAVPGTFQPKEIDGTKFMDGGTVSSTHAALLLDTDVDLAIVAAPMARPDHGWVLRHSHRRFHHEVGRLERAGVEVAGIAPEREQQDLFKGFPRRQTETTEAIRTHARTQTLKALDQIQGSSGHRNPDPPAQPAP